MSTDPKDPAAPPAEDEEAWDGEDRATRSVPAILLDELHGRPKSAAPPAPPPDQPYVPTNGLGKMLITDEMLGKKPRPPSGTLRMQTAPRRDEEPK